MFGGARYALTGSGWLQALRDSGVVQDPVFLRDAGKLFATLKKHVKGREQNSMITLDNAAKESRLSESWIFNAIESNLLQAVFGKEGAVWCRIRRDDDIRPYHVRVGSLESHSVPNFTLIKFF